MVRLIYVSRMTDECDMEAIQEILRVSRAKNDEAGISGILCYDPMFFLQCVEGPKSTVNDLYKKILADSRHSDVLLLEYADITDRTFGRWKMGFLRSSDIDIETVSAFTKSERFDPYQLTGEKARDFLVSIAAQERKHLNKQD